MKELEIIQHRQIEGVSLFFDTVDYRTPHVHPEWELLWILEEPLAVNCESESLLAQPGQILLFSPDQAHEFHKQNESCSFLCLQVSPKLLGTARTRIEDHDPEKYLSVGEYRELKREIRDLAAAYFERPAHYELYCVGKIQLIFYRLFSCMPSRILTREEEASTGRRNTRLMELMRFVDENYMHKIRLSDFAEQQGCSLSYLSHFVKDTLNQNFQEYVNSVRVNAACQMMADGGMKMLDVCMAAGFSDYRYFSKAFKRQFGMTPEQYSRQPVKPETEGTALRHSLHSLERFYDEKQSRELLQKLSVE